ncbi:MAG: tetratricopeptide repeat protein, partial [Phycisphaerales bacterium]
ATRNNQARLYRLQGRIDEAERIFRELVEIREAAEPRDEVEVVRARVNLAEALMWAGRAGDAAEAVAPALEACGTLVSEDHPVTPLAREIGSWAALGRGDLDESERLRRSAIAGYTRILGAAHPATLSADVRLAWLLADTDRPDEALALAEAALTELRAIFGETHDSTLEAMTAVAYAAGRAGDRVRAAAIDRQVYEARVRRFGAEHPTTLAALNNLGAAEWWAGQYEAALQTYRELLELRRRVSGDDHPETLTVINNLGFALQRLGELSAAREQFDLAASERARVLGPTHQATVQSAMAAADTRFQLEDYTDAADAYLAIADTLRAAPDRNEPQYVLAVASASGCMTIDGQAQQALETLDAYTAELDIKAARPTDRVRLDRARAEALTALGSYDDAEALFQGAYATAADALGADAPETRRTARAMADMYARSDRPDLAAEWRARAGDDPDTPVAGG